MSASPHYFLLLTALPEKEPQANSHQKPFDAEVGEAELQPRNGEAE